jgi:hypothetical protein
VADERTRLAVVLQHIAPDLAAPLWRVKTLRDLPVAWREHLLGCEATSRGFDQDKEPNAYGRDLEELFDALGL